MSAVVPRVRKTTRANYFVGNVDIAETPLDGPYTAFFEPVRWEDALAPTQGLDGRAWTDAEFQRQIGRRREALDAYVRSLEQ
jgi:hypothetical protein